MSRKFRLTGLLQLAWVILPGACAQVTVTAPSTNTVVRAADDYATQAFQDPWDMRQWTDLGWYTFGVDQPLANLTGINFSGGIFSATSISSNPNFWLLDTYTPGSSPLGKIGSLYPIDSTKYRRFMIRMNLTGSGLSNPPSQAQSAQMLWSNNTLYQTGGPSTSNAFFTYPGWWVYSVDLPTLGVAVGAAWSALPVDSLRFDPLSISGVNINVGWARLVSNDPTLYGTISWTGASAVDIFLDNDTNFSNGNVGQIAGSVSGGSYSFYVGGLPQGTYYVAIRPAGSSTAPSYSSGSWTVADIPTLVFTSPSPEGSADDFATVQLNNPWNMKALSDIDYTTNVTGLNITNINAQDEAGNALGNVRVYAGTTSGNFGDPEIFPLWWFGRGRDYRIDTSRYRILSLKSGIVGNRDINNGSIGRIIWRVNGEPVENVSQDIILKHLPNANVMQNIIADMKTLPIEPPGLSPSQTGWNGMLDGFRVKPDEFSAATNFYIESVKLSALEKANASYTIAWNYANQGPASPTLQLYWDGTGSGFAGTLIASGLAPGTGSYIWNTSALTNGTYYIYARLVNGTTVMNQSYAKWPVVVDHSYQVLPGISLDKADVWFGATQNGAVVTGPQTVHVTTAPGVSWSVSSNQSFMVVTPSSGTGSGSFNISIQSNALPSPSSLDAVVTVSSAQVTNSPQYVHMFLKVINTGSTAPPFGSFDTPTNNITGVAGAIAVTGWALGDIEVVKVQIWRDPIGSEVPASNGLIYIGDATFVPGARPDVQALYPTNPLNDRAGWGYGMLTTGLPNNGGSPGTGNGTYRLHAIAADREGHVLELGTKTITCDNAHASRPFGTIDTPGQGGSVVSGTVINFGWALTQQPYMIPINGSTMTVTVDGVAVGHPVYNQYRSDIANGFPGLANSNGAVGYFYIDTTTLSNGMHTIGWLVSDNAGRADGVGSRFFNVLNNSTGQIVGLEPTAAPPASEPLELPKDTGVLSIETQELGRIELLVGANAGYSIVNGDRYPLPAGSTLKAGVFYWQLGPAFLGDFNLVFERPLVDGTIQRVPARVHVRPKR